VAGVSLLLEGVELLFIGSGREECVEKFPEAGPAGPSPFSFAIRVYALDFPYTHCHSHGTCVAVVAWVMQAINRS
jgi:hypothetical protein